MIDFSDNEIKRLDNFPKMIRLTSIIANNNYVSRIGTFAENVPNVTCLVLTNNRILTLGEVDNIALFKKLVHLSLLENPVNVKQHYRHYVIHSIPSLKTLDYKKITKKEKDETTAFFKSSAGKLFSASVLTEKTAQQDVSSGKSAAPVMTLSDEQKILVRKAIENAKTRDEIDIIEKHLKVRDVPYPYLEEYSESSLAYFLSNLVTPHSELEIYVITDFTLQSLASFRCHELF